MANKLNAKNLKEVMTRLAHDGDRESYEKLWTAINTLWNLGLVDYKLNNDMIHIDHELYESGETAPMYDGQFDLIAIEF